MLLDRKIPDYDNIDNKEYAHYRAIFDTFWGLFRSLYPKHNIPSMSDKSLKENHVYFELYYHKYFHDYVGQ